MKFRTILTPLTYPFEIAHQQPILSIGSCFTEHIGSKLERLKFSILQNPYGIVYNPISILAQLDELSAAKVYSESDLVFYNDKYHSWNHHSRFSHNLMETSLLSINRTLHPVHEVFGKLSHLHLTFGSAWVYERKATKEIVANCHKYPSLDFEKKMISVSEIVDGYHLFFKQFFATNPSVNVVLTLSPVRHVRDGIVEDRLSKSVLRIAIAELTRSFSNVYYFPSYELITDDLRDYRFYKDDLVHPTEFAIEYVWEYFIKAFFGQETLSINRKLDSIQKRLGHSGEPSDLSYQKFRHATLLEIAQLANQYPWLEF